MHKKALFIGRFQPFHKGHEFAIDYIFEKNPNLEVLNIAIGSINKNNEKNPWTFEQRKQMLEKTLKEKPYFDRIRIKGIKDYNDNERWKQNIDKLFDYDVVYSNNAVVKKIFGKKCKQIAFLKRHLYRGTKIREKIKKGIEKIKSFIPKTIFNLLAHMNQ